MFSVFRSSLFDQRNGECAVAERFETFGLRHEVSPDHVCVGFGVNRGERPDLHTENVFV